MHRTLGLSSPGGKDERAGGRGLRGHLAVELAADEAQHPGGAGLLAACAVDAGEGVLGDAELYDRASWPVCLRLGWVQLGDLQWNAL
jgi:hypothetical protein